MGNFHDLTDDEQQLSTMTHMQIREDYEKSFGGIDWQPIEEAPPMRPVIGVTSWGDMKIIRACGSSEDGLASGWQEYKFESDNEDLDDDFLDSLVQWFPIPRVSDEHLLKINPILRRMVRRRDHYDKTGETNC